MKRSLMMLVVIFVVVCIAQFCIISKSEAALFSIWADTNDDNTKDLFLGNVASYDGTISGAANYHYFSSSGHPINGPVPAANALELFIYQNITNHRNFLNIISGVDGSGGQNSFSAIIDVTGSNLDPGVVRSDDNGELIEDGDNHFVGDWSFKNNTDGGVIGPLKGKNWEAVITPGEADTLTSHDFYSSDGSIISLDGGEQSYHYFVFPAPAGNIVPEPCSMGLFGVGLLGLARLRRKK